MTSASTPPFGLCRVGFHASSPAAYEAAVILSPDACRDEESLCTLRVRSLPRPVRGGEAHSLVPVAAVEIHLGFMRRRLITVARALIP